MHTFHPVFRNCSQSLRRRGLLLGLLLVPQAANLPVMGQFGRTEQHFAQVVLNEGSTTSLSLYNPSNTETILVRIQILDASGGTLVDQEVELGPGETENMTFGDPDQPLKRGWAKLTSEGEFIATAFFQLSIGGQLKPRIGVLPSLTAEEIRLFGFVNKEFKSGIAFHNPGGFPTEVTFRLTGQAGQGTLELLDEKTLMVDPQESVAAFLNDPTFFGPDLTNYAGAVEVGATFPIAMLSLTQEPGGDVATVSVETPLGEPGPQGPRRKVPRVLKVRRGLPVLKVRKGSRETKATWVHQAYKASRGRRVHRDRRVSRDLRDHKDLPALKAPRGTRATHPTTIGPRRTPRAPM